MPKDNNAWIRVQKKTFQKWSSNHLVKKFGKEAVIEDLTEAFEDGWTLVKLLNSLYDEPMPRLNKNPKMRPHLLDNVVLALKMLESDVGVKTNFLKSTHLVDKDEKMILGMIWAIILHYQIAGISVEEMSAKEGLLLWCQRKTKGYRDVDPPTIKGFTSDWANGLAFCALIHKHRPDLIDYDSLDKNNAKENLELAFSVAEKELGIPRLLDVEDLTDVPKPDERSVMTQVSEYFHCFSKYGETDAAGRRIADLVAMARANDKLKADYNLSAQALRDWILKKTEDHKDRQFDGTLEGVERQWGDHTQYKKSEKPEKMGEKLALEGQFATLQTKLRVNGRAAYVPPAGLSPTDIDQVWDVMVDEEKLRAQALRDELKRQQRIKVLVDRFTRRANALEAWGQQNQSFVSSDDCGNDLATVQAHLKTLEGFEADFEAASPRLERTKKLGDELVQLQYSGAAEIQSRSASLDSLWSSLSSSAATRRSNLEAELARQQQFEAQRVEFAKKSRVFVNWIEDADVLQEPVRFHSLEELGDFTRLLDDLSAELPTKKAEFESLEGLANDMQAAGITSNIYAIYDIDTIRQKWQTVQQGEQAQREALQTETQRLADDDQVCQNFASKASDFSNWCGAQKSDIEKIASGSSDQSALQQLDAKSSEIQQQQPQFDELVSLEHQAADRNILDNKHTTHDVDSLRVEYTSLKNLVSSQSTTIQKELAKAEQSTGVDPEQLSEFKEMFAHFDKDNSNTLQTHEFKACLSALGISKTDAEMSAVMQEVAANGANITFSEFLNWMTSELSKEDTSDSLKEAFKLIAGNKDTINEGDMRKVLDDETIQYLLANMTPTSDGEYDYKSFSDAQYA